MSKELVVKGFYAARAEVQKTGAVKYKRISKTFHVRDAAQSFANIANVGAPDDMRARVIEDIGVEPLAKGAGR